jgi:hypothetical protein
MPSPLGREAPEGPGEVRNTVRLFRYFGEFVLRTDLIRPCRTPCVGAPSPKGKAFICKLWIFLLYLWNFYVKLN